MAPLPNPPPILSPAFFRLFFWKKLPRLPAYFIIPINVVLLFFILSSQYGRSFPEKPALLLKVRFFFFLPLPTSHTPPSNLKLLPPCCSAFDDRLISMLAPNWLRNEECPFGRFAPHFCLLFHPIKFWGVYLYSSPTAFSSNFEVTFWVSQHRQFFPKQNELLLGMPNYVTDLEPTTPAASRPHLPSPTCPVFPSKVLLISFPSPMPKNKTPTISARPPPYPRIGPVLLHTPDGDNTSLVFSSSRLINTD